VKFPTLEQSLKVEADCLEVSSPSISIASWSDLNAIYQENSAAALEVVNNVLNSPRNTWNYPSPGSPRLQYPPVSRASSPVVPWSPTVTTSPELQFEFVVPSFPFLEPTPIDIDPYVVCSLSPPTPEPTEEALRAAAEFDLEQLGEEAAAHIVRLTQEELDALLPSFTQELSIPRSKPPTPHSHHRSTGQKLSTLTSLLLQRIAQELHVTLA